VVVAIVAIIAGAVVSSYDGLAEDAKTKMALSDMSELRSAFQKFRQDTLLLPKEGALDDSQLNPTPNAVWFDHPANFDQLFTKPSTTNDRWGSSPGKSRAWRGPYCNGRVDAMIPSGGGLTISGASTGSLPPTAVPQVLDPWGKPFLYIVPSGTNFNAAYLQSYGPDLILNTADDIKLDILK
jgi:type II secretory pathway pseudopilin PulG